MKNYRGIGVQKRGNLRFADLHSAYCWLNPVFGPRLMVRFLREMLYFLEVDTPEDKERIKGMVRKLRDSHLHGMTPKLAILQEFLRREAPDWYDKAFSCKNIGGTTSSSLADDMEDHDVPPAEGLANDTNVDSRLSGRDGDHVGIEASASDQ